MLNSTIPGLIIFRRFIYRTKAGIFDKKGFDYYYNAWGSDTTDCTPDYVKTFVVIATGISKNGQKYYLFDSDNDYNLANEIPYETSINANNLFENTNSEFQPHKIICEKFIDNKIQKDSTWMAFFEHSDMMWVQF
jgi:hypothetical protein